MEDRFPYSTASKPFGPAHRWFTVVPHATDLLPARPLYLVATAAGNVRMMNPEGDDVTRPVAVGEIIEARPTRIVAPETTATLIAYW